MVNSLHVYRRPLPSEKSVRATSPPRRLFLRGGGRLYTGSRGQSLDVVAYQKLQL